MRVTARQLFEQALAEASIDRAFQRHVDCERGVLRVCEDLYQLDSYSRVLVSPWVRRPPGWSPRWKCKPESDSKELSRHQSTQGPVARFRYFHGGHPTPNDDSVRAAAAMLKSLFALDSSCV